MHYEVQLWLIRWGIQEIGRNVFLESLQTFTSIPSLTTLPLITGSTSLSSEGFHTYPTSFIGVDNHNIHDLSLHHFFRGEIWLVCSFCNGNNVWEFTFADLLIILACPSFGALRWGYAPTRHFLVSFASFHILIQLDSLNQLSDGIPQVYVVIGVMVVALMESEVFWFIRLGYLSDRIRWSDSFLLNFGIHTVLVDPLTRYHWWGVPIILPLHVSVRTIPMFVTLFPRWKIGVRFTRSGVIEMCGRFLFQNHKRFGHGHQLFDGFDLSLIKLFPKRMVALEVVLKNPALKAFLSLVYLDWELSFIL